jgi:ComF family protein
MFKKFLKDLLFPQFCLNCNKEGGIICQDCLSLVEITDFQFCPFCKTPQRVFKEGKCHRHKKYNLDGLFSATTYQNPLVKNLIGKFKYQPFLKSLSQPLASLIIAHFFLSENKEIIERNKRNAYFLPIPLSRLRERQRGFNQTAELAKILSIFFNIPLKNNLLKTKKTLPQMTLKKEERAKNIKGVFRLKNSQEVKGKIIFLVDDVFTTGSTIEEAAKVLKTAGAKEVWGVVIAREPLNN